MNKHIPPHSETAERVVLGQVLVKHKEFSFLRSEMKFTPEFFYIPAHSIIFEAMNALYLEGRPCDLHAVVIQLTKAGNFDKVGGAAYLDAVYQCAPPDGIIGFYADEVKSCYEKRKVLQIAIEMQSDACNPSNEDGREVAAKGVVELCKIVDSRPEKKTCDEYAGESIDAWIRMAEFRHSGKPVPMLGMATGFKRLDGLLGGLQDGLAILGAKESTGKTSLEAQIAGYIMQSIDVPVLRITRDSKVKDLVRRDLCRESSVPMNFMDNGEYNQIYAERIKAARERMKKWKVDIVDDTFKWPDIAALIRADVAKRGTRLVTVDFLQRFRTGDRQTDRSRADRTEEIVSGFKDLTLELGICALILSQFSRDEIDPRYHINSWLDQKPSLQKLRDSGSIEQQADQVMLLSKIADIEDENGVMGRVTILGNEVAKNRNGSPGTVMMRFDRPMFRMEEVTVLQQEAIKKYLRDDRNLQAKRKKLADIEQPYFTTVKDAIERSSEMEGKAYA